MTFAAIASFALPAHAADEGPAKPLTDKSVTAGDVAATPIEDLNLKKDEIPPVLLKAQQDPYDMTGLRKCPNVSASIEELDQVLGPDYDLAYSDDRKTSMGSVAKSVVGAFIPFRGVIREITGANKHQQVLQDAIAAGMTRRAFLKGIGLKQGCRYPARPADAAVRARLANDAAKATREEADKAKKS